MKAHVKSTFLQTGTAKRDDYVCPTRESCDLRQHWLLLAAAYEIVNANVKFQNQADGLIMDIGSSHMSVVFQLFHLM